ncbi:MAG: hypothetical protein ACXWDJ_12005 [Aeromicrobium sp.]
MTTVLLFAEHELNKREVTQTLEALADLRVDCDDEVDVTALVPCSATWPVPLMDDLAAAHGASASGALSDARHDGAVARTSARRTLRHVLSAVRRGGYPARGELVTARDAVHDVATEAVARGATTALVVSSPHRLAHLLHRDLEHRLSRAGIAHIIRVDGVGATAAT